jgi:hypothetical protein
MKVFRSFSNIGRDCSRWQLVNCYHRHNDEFKTLKGKLDNLDATIVRAASKIEYLSEALDESKTKTIQDWVSTIQYKDHHDELSTSRMPDSGVWLLKHKTYRRWRRASYSSFLWLNGIGSLPKKRLICKYEEARC